MYLANSHYFIRPIKLLLLTTCCVAAFFIWEGHLGIDLTDEGFVWYGARMVNQGRVPIRDFYAYDPGRYYLTAWIMQFFGDDGLITSRIAEALMQGLGLFLALLMLSPLLKFDKKFNFICLLFTALILLIWMVPLYKSFDITSSIALIAILTYLIEVNTLKAIFWSGFCISIIAIMGRNHGLYGSLANTGVLIYLYLHERRYPIFSMQKWWLAGLSVGYIPLFLMMLLIPGFGPAFVDSVLFLFRDKATNMHFPIPWHWYASSLQGFITCLFFMAVFLFGLYGFLRVCFTKNRKLPALFIACAFLALPYAHYVYARADVYHLALGIFPLLISLFTYLYLKVQSKYMLLVSFSTLFILSAVVISPLHPSVRAYQDKNWEVVDIRGDKIKIDYHARTKIELFKRLIAQYAENGQPFLVAPFNFIMHPIFDRESPMWDIYPFFMRSAKEQAADIARIEKANPGLIVIYDEALDGVAERSFHYTHALIFKYIAEHYEIIHDDSVGPDTYIYKIKKTEV